MIRKPVFMKGNEAVIEGAIAAGCRAVLGYPITPSTEGLEYAVIRMKQIGGIAKQLESEAAVSHALYGAGAVGIRAMTITSGPGLNWMHDAVDYMATAEVPTNIIDIMRGGPALGNIAPSQADVRSVKGGANGDYRTIILAPSSVQDLADFTFLAFELADKWRNPVFVLGDGLLGQMKETLILPEPIIKLPEKPWRLSGAKNRPPNKFIPFDLDPVGLEVINKKRNQKYNRIKETEVRYEAINIEKPDVLVVAFGLIARTMKSVIKEAEKESLSVGLIRPITLWPFPDEIINRAADKTNKILVIEMNMGQIVDDVRLAVNGKAAVKFYGRAGGIVLTSEEIKEEIKNVLDIIKSEVQ